MWTDILQGGGVGGAVGGAGAFAAEGVLLALRARRNAALTAKGELPFKDEVFRPKWGLLGVAGIIAGGVARPLGASVVVTSAVALALPAVLVAMGVYFLRPGAGTAA